MNTYALKIRFTALFIVAFICLNAGGALCVAYCRSEGPSPGKAHPTPEQTSHHCGKSGGPKKEPVDSVALTDNRLDCCPMTVSFFGGPIEKQVRQSSPTVIALVAKIETAQLERFRVERFATRFNYRGPPPLDRRTDRIKHRLLLI